MQIATHGATLVLCGEFDVRSTYRVRTALYEHLAAVDGDVVVDLTGVTTIDVPALRVLAVATRQAGHRGQRLTLRGCSPAVRRLLALTRLIKVVQVDRAMWKTPHALPVTRG